MLKDKAYKNYYGGKTSNGTYQTIINHIPPHDIFLSLFLGNCGITRKIRAAKYSVLNDIDPNVINNWKTLNLPNNYRLFNIPALKILQALKDFVDCPGIIFIYLDPPYRKVVRRNKKDVYNFEMSDLDHQDLLSQIVAMSDQPNVKIMISHYPDVIYDEILNGWSRHDYYSMTRNGMILERIYYNYTLTDQLHDYSYIGEDFREREAMARIKRNFIKKLNRLPAKLRNSIIYHLASH